MDSPLDLTQIQWIKGHRNLPEAHIILKVPGITTVLATLPDPELEAFIKSVGKEKAEEIMKLAAWRGSAMHIFIQRFVAEYSKTKDVSKALKYTQEESPKILQLEEIPQNKIEEGRDLFYKFYYSDYSSQYLDVLGIELIVYSPSYYYRGKLDIMYKNKMFGLSICDFKSSNGKIKKDSVKEYKDLLQLGAYSNAIEEMYALKNIKINHASILCVDKQNDALQEIVCAGAELEQYKQKFKELVVQWHQKNGQSYLFEQ